MGRERDAKPDGGKKGMISTLYPRLYLLCGLHGLKDWSSLHAGMCTGMGLAAD